jgi:hypothetical protein
MATPNALFAIIAASNVNAIDAKLQTIAPWLYIKIKEGEWLLIAPSSTTSKEVSDRLGLTGAEPPIASAIVLRVETYFGRTVPSTWEWITTKRGAELGTTQTTT